MAAKTVKISMEDLMVPLHLLANTGQNKGTESPEIKGKNSFDELLKQNLLLLWKALTNDPRLQGLYKDMKYSFVLKSCVFNGENEVDERDQREGDEIPSMELRKQEDISLLKVKQKTSKLLSGITSNSHAIRWTFVQVCLQMLSFLRELLQCSKDSKRVDKSASVDLISVSDQKVISTVIQFVVVLGISPNLLPGVGVPIECRSGFSHVLKNDSVENYARCPKCLFEFTITLVKCLSQPSLSMLILSHHLGDILSSLLQLAYCHEMSSVYNKVYNKCHKEGICEGGILISKAESEECAKALQNIVDKMYQPLVVRELLFLQGGTASQKPHAKKAALKERNMEKFEENAPGLIKVNNSATKAPTWMKDICGHLLSRCLIKNNGIQNVLRGILESASGTSIEWKVCQGIAQLIANCPLQVQSADDYFRCVCPQVLALLYLPNARLRQQYSCVTVQIIHAMMTRHPDLATKYIAYPLMKPFLLATEESESLKKCTLMADEVELTQCIENLHKVFVASPDSACLIMKPIEKIISPVFELFCFTRHGVSHVRTALQELLSTFFKRSNERVALVMLYALAFNKLPSEDSRKEFLKSVNISKAESPNKEDDPHVNLMKSHCAFAYGEGGGVILVRTDLPSDKQKINSNILDEILGKEKDIYETRAFCLVEILVNIRREEVPGRFFIYLLQQVQQIIFGMNDGENGKVRALMIFHVLALMCEKLGPSVLKNTHHMITFIETTVTRALHVYHETSNEESVSGTFELETLTMALGMLSALLSGAVKIEPSDYVKLQELVPLLRRITDEHIEEEIKELANDLLVVILTQVGVWSEKNKQSEERSKHLSSGKTTSTNNQGQDNGRNSLHDSAFEKQQSAEFDKAFEQLCDPLLPVRGHALMRLAVFLRNRDAKAMKKVDILVKTFQDSLIHDDSYIYLAAIEGLVAAADVKTADVVPLLAREFVTCHDGEVENSRLDQNMAKGMYPEPEGGANKPQRSVTKRSATTRMKLGEALLRATKMCGELVPCYFQCLVQAFLTGVKDDESFIRASSLSNLGEVCRLAPHTLPSALHEIFLCVSSVLKSDKASEVRQAAVLVITLVLKGLGNSSVKVLNDTLKDLYRLLKLVESRDEDETTRVHAQVALGELENIMRQELFPQQRLVKHINVLPL